MTDQVPGPNVGQRVAAGMAWTVSFRLLDRFLGLISSVVLARLLVPDDFGLVAMAMAVLAMVEMFRGLGFEAALIRKPDASQAEFDTAWTLNVLLGVATALFMLGIAAPMASFFREPRVENIVYLLALVPVSEGLVNIGVVAFRKDLNFRKDFQLLALRRVLAVTITVSLALYWRSYWALPVGNVIGWGIGVLLSYWMHPYRPRLTLSAHRSVLGFSAWIFLNNVLFFLRMRGASIAIGRVGGVGPLGIFEIAFQIASLPTSALVMPLNRALFPGYVQLRSDMAKFRYGVLQVIAGMALVAIPAGVGIASTAHLIVEAFLGPKWLAAIPAVQMLALFGVSIALQTNIQSVYNALGKPSLQALMTALTLVLLLPLLVWWVRLDGVDGAARAYLVTGALMLPVNYAVCLKLVQIRWRTLLSLVWRPLIAAAVMAGTLMWLFPAQHVGGGSLSALANFLLAAATGMFVYVGVVALLWLALGKPVGGESLLLRHAGRFLGKFRRRARED
jgi:lipopolysaccharide exporter